MAAPLGVRAILHLGGHFQMRNRCRTRVPATLEGFIFAHDGDKELKKWGQPLTNTHGLDKAFTVFSLLCVFVNRCPRFLSRSSPSCTVTTNWHKSPPY